MDEPGIEHRCSIPGLLFRLADKHHAKAEGILKFMIDAGCSYPDEKDMLFPGRRTNILPAQVSIPEQNFGFSSWETDSETVRVIE